MRDFREVLMIGAFPDCKASFIGCLVGILSFAACADSQPSSSGSGGASSSGGVSSSGAPHDGGPDATTDSSIDDATVPDVPVLPPPDGAILDPCQLPGSIQFTSSGTLTVPGSNPSWPSLSFLHLPIGFCAHYYGTVGNARQIRFAPGGELFVSSPTKSTTGGGTGGQQAIVILPDDNQDGVGDTAITFLSGMAFTQGMLFANGYFYFQDGVSPSAIDRIPYAMGDRKPSGASEQVADITVYQSTVHWPKTLDLADDGTIYVGNGGDQDETCDLSHPFHGGILKITPGSGNGGANVTEIAKGLRNPINIRCARGHDVCFALELALDFSANEGGREKIVPIRQGDDWGFPCCATTNVPYSTSTPATTCATVTQDTNSFLIGDTPFGIDFEPGFWPAPWTGQAFVVTHGVAGSWSGARLVAIPMNASTGALSPSTDISGNDVGITNFGTGWDDGTMMHGRPAAVSFSADGRLFVANDNDGVIFWIAAMQ